jgi:hypothetical protein
MREVSELPKTAQAIISFATDHGIPMHFNPVTMGGLSVQEFEEVEAHLGKLPSSKAIRGTLEAIKNTRLAGLGPWEGTLPPLKLPEKLETLIWLAATKPEKFGDAHNIQVMKNLTSSESALLHEGLRRKKLELLATGDLFFEGEHIEQSISIAMEHTGPQAAGVEAAASKIATGHSSSSPLTKETAAKSEESWLDRLAKGKWTGKKGLAVVGATVAVGAIGYGAMKLLSHDKTSENQQAR